MPLKNSIQPRPKMDVDAIPSNQDQRWTWSVSWRCFVDAIPSNQDQRWPSVPWSVSWTRFHPTKTKDGRAFRGAFLRRVSSKPRPTKTRRTAFCGAFRRFCGAFCGSVSRRFVERFVEAFVERFVDAFPVNQDQPRPRQTAFRGQDKRCFVDVA